jgi:hypothetical protein
MVGAPGTVLLGVLLVEGLELPPPQATNCNKAMTMSATRKPCFILSVPSCDQKAGIDFSHHHFNLVSDSVCSILSFK